MMRTIRFFLGLISLVCLPAAMAEEHRQLLWGDTHLHTNNSFDAFLNGNQSVAPADAFRFGRGQPVIHPYHRARVQIETPLDFMVVSDHAEFLGGIKDIYFDGIGIEDPSIIERILVWYNEYKIRDAIDSGEGQAYFDNLLPKPGDSREAAAKWKETVGQAIPGSDKSLSRAWAELLNAAQRYNEPGVFTAFAGWEWSSQPGSANLHRVVISNATPETGREFIPFASTDSPYPEDLWAWLAETEQSVDVRFLAIPHNPNVSKGLMFDTRTLRGDDIDSDYAAKRSRYEPVLEVTQIKGDSETHPSLSPDDPFANYETYAYLLAAKSELYEPTEGDYARAALLTGMTLEQEIGVNPFKFGMIGSTDSHTGLATAEEPNFWGKFANDSIPANKDSSALGSASGWSMSAAGLAAVWADENTRESIMDAMFRREVYATTGPRIAVRFFGGWSFEDGDLNEIAASGYAKGVPMGGTLFSGEAAQSPVFMVRAEMDPVGAKLDRVQIVKGWLDATGQKQEHVYDVAWAERGPAAQDDMLPAIADTVDRKTGMVTGEQGSEQLQAVWTDPMFNPDEPAFYYVRVLQVPTARHSLLDSIALGAPPPEKYPEVIQERAYTSPIWFAP